MGYLIFNTRLEAEAVNNLITANMLIAESNRASENGLLSVSVNGQIRPEATLTTQWAVVVKLTGNRFAIPAPPSEWMGGVDAIIQELSPSDFPKPENPFA